MNYKIVQAYKFAQKAVITVKVKASRDVDTRLVAQDLLTNERELFSYCNEVVLMIEDEKGFTLSFKSALKQVCS